MSAPDRKFDLNIEKVLEHWTVAHAVREILANALDEHALTGTNEPEIIRMTMVTGTSETLDAD